MKQYTDSGARGNMFVAHDSEYIADRWACRISRSKQVSYSIALAIVRANKIGTEARND